MFIPRRKTKYYRDLDPNFQVHPLTGDIAKLYDEDAVAFSMKNLILTRFYGRPFQPGIGTGISDLLFELFDPFTELLIKKEIETVIRNYEPRAKITNMETEVSEDDNSIRVIIDFMTIGVESESQLKISLQRVR